MSEDNKNLQSTEIQPCPLVNKKDQILKELRKDIHRCKEYLKAHKENCEKWDNLLDKSQLGFLSIGFILASLPAFVPALQANWWSVPQMAFGLLALVLEVHKGQKNYQMNSRDDVYAMNSLDSLEGSIKRKLAEKGVEREIGDDFLKRVQEKLSSVKTMRNIPCEEV